MSWCAGCARAFLNSRVAESAESSSFWCGLCATRAEWSGAQTKVGVPHHFHPSTLGFGAPTKRHSSVYISHQKALSCGKSSEGRATLLGNLDTMFEDAVLAACSGEKWHVEY